MPDTTSIVCRTFGDILSICENRAKINGTVQDRIKNFFKGVVNEKYIQISTERNWFWRKFDRAFVMSQPITTGTVDVANNSRAITFSSLTLDNTYIGRSIRINNQVELYRIVGIDSSTVAVLDAPFVWDDDADATFQIYLYEFPLPPDCDVINQVYVDGVLSNSGQLEERNVLEFNRILSKRSAYVGVPLIYCKDGKQYQNSIPPLDEMVLDYDFLGGEVQDQVDRLRIFPISPDRQRLIHINYSIHVDPLKELTDEPIMPIDNRWILIHAALAEWFRINGNMASASSEKNEMNKMLMEMRAEHQKTEPKPKMIVDGRRYVRESSYNSNSDLLRLSRILDS